MVTVWLLLATILVHALLPGGSPIRRTSGSAFSAATADVSLGPSRRTGDVTQSLEARAPARVDGVGPDAPLLAAALLLLAALFGSRAGADVSFDPQTRLRPSSARRPFQARAPPRI